MKKIRQWLARLLDGSTSQKLAEAEEARDAAVGEARELRAEVKQLSNDLDKRQALLDTTRWTHPHFVELAPIQMPLRFTLSTWKIWTHISRLRGRLGAPDAFNGHANAAGLYWALTHASRTGFVAINELKDEPGMTGDFVISLQEQLAKANDLLGAETSVAIAQIFQHRKPALKEVTVGADLLMVISGDGLVPRGGVRLLWIQFKLAEPGQPMNLDVHRRPNAAGSTQFEALTAVHSTGQGSFGIYALASNAFRFFASVTVDKLHLVDPRVPTTCNVDLGIEGARFQEIALELLNDANFGEFVTSSAVIQYVDALAAKRSIVPLRVVGVSSGSELVSGRDLVQQLKIRWDARLHDIQQRLDGREAPSLEIERDDGPSPRR